MISILYCDSCEKELGLKDDIIVVHLIVDGNQRIDFYCEPKCMKKAIFEYYPENTHDTIVLSCIMKRGDYRG